MLTFAYLPLCGGTCLQDLELLRHDEVFLDALGARRNPRIPPSLTTLDEIAHAALRLVTDESLAGRVLIYWNRRGPTLLPADDPGFARLDPYPL